MFGLNPIPIQLFCAFEEHQCVALEVDARFENVFTL
jgi:hypothetical protein